MTNIIQFPGKPVRDWALIERAIREVLTKAGASSEMVDEICPHMKKHYEEYSNMPLAFKTQLPAGMDPQLSKTVNEAIRQGVEGMAEQIHDLTNHVMLDLVIKEIELCSLRMGHPNAG